MLVTLSKEQEKLVIKQVQDGDSDSALRLLEEFQREIHSVLKNIDPASYGVDKQDLIQEAHLAVLEAAGNFDLDADNAFWTFAHGPVRTAVNKIRDAAKGRRREQRFGIVMLENGSEEEADESYSGESRSPDYVLVQSGIPTESRSYTTEMERIAEVSCRAYWGGDDPFGKDEPPHIVIKVTKEERKLDRVAMFVEARPENDRKYIKALLAGKSGREVSQELDVSEAAISQRRKKLFGDFLETEG